MKTDTLLLIAGAIGIGYLISQHKKAAASATATQAVAVPRSLAVQALPEEGADIAFVEPAVQYVPVWGGSWGPSWGGWRGGGGGGGGHHGGHHGMHGFHGRRR